MILRAIAEAQQGGARLSRACAVIGISQRTVQRWRAHPGEDDHRCGPRYRPSNALTTMERSRVLAVMSSREYRGVSPKQIVPRLADKGMYLASESTMYRLRRAVGATRRDIFMQFLTESLSVTLVGMVLGCFLGWGVSIVLANTTELPLIISWQPFALAVVSALLIGTFFGVQPARRAARLHPVEALQ